VFDFFFFSMLKSNMLFYDIKSYTFVHG